MDELLVARDEHIVTLTLNRPDAGNSFSRALLAALGDAIANLHDDREARVVVITGAGGKIFCAGADLKERATMSQDDVRGAVTTIRATISAVAGLPMPSIAAINGHALGGGLELALACDLRVIAQGATVGLTETTLAIIPGGGGTQRLQRLVGPGRAKELIFTGRRVGADEALRLGIVEEDGGTDPGARALELARTIAANGPVAVRAAKEAIDRGSRLPLDDALRLETELYGRTIQTKDREEGLTAFREKRSPRYTGE